MAKWFLVLYTALIVWWCNAPSAFGMSTNETDRLALLAFKAAIDDQAFSYGALSSWNDSVHYCDWNGILCSRRHRDRVVQLNLTSKGLVGSLSPHIGNLSFLRRIILSNNNFHGPIPEEIGRLFRLQVIRLGNNSFGGGLPNNLSRCPNLEDLFLAKNQLSGNIPTQLGSWPKLRALILYQNKFSGTIPPSIGNLSYLVQLFFSECNLHGEIPEGIANLRRLTVLGLQEYGMGDMASTNGDVYSFGILLLEMFTGKRPTDSLFQDHLNLHNFVKNALPERVMDIVDPSIQLEHNNGSWINDCMVAILTIGVACSSESPRDRMEMGTVVSKLCKIKKKYLGERSVETLES